jgi:hypothetical protein
MADGYALLRANRLKHTTASNLISERHHAQISPSLSSLLFAVVVGQAQPPSPSSRTRRQSRYLGRTVTIRDFSQWNYTVARYTDSALGCPSAPANAIPQGINGYTFIFNGNGVTYDWRISEDGSIVFPCDAGLQQQGTAAPPPTSLPATALPPSATTAPCPPNYAGYLPPRLQVGAQARIERRHATASMTPKWRCKSASSVRSTADVIGSSCDNYRLIWQVRFNNVMGWIAEGVRRMTASSNPLATTNDTDSVAVPLPDERCYHPPM